MAHYKVLTEDEELLELAVSLKKQMPCARFISSPGVFSEYLKGSRYLHLYHRERQYRAAGNFRDFTSEHRHLATCPFFVQQRRSGRSVVILAEFIQYPMQVH